MAVLAIAAFYALLESIGITCPIKYLTGISCAGCGMSRAWLSFLHGDIAAAWHYHPLFLTPPLILILPALKKRMNPEIIRMIIFIVALLYGIVYMYRLMIGNGDIVVFDPQNGLVGRGMRAVIKFMQTEV